MAIVLKENKTFTPSTLTGLDLTSNSFYGVIDKIEYDKKEKICFFSVDLYASINARQEGKVVIDRINFNYDNESFDEIGSNGFTVPQAYIKALSILTDWESDEV